MANERIFGLGNFVGSLTDYKVAFDKSGEPQAVKFPASDLFQTASFNNTTREFTLSNGNTIIIPNLQSYGIAGFDFVMSGVQLVVDGGVAMDSTNTVEISPTAQTKNLTSWSAGSGGGILDAGILQANKVYYLYAIYDSTNLVSDLLLSLNDTLPTLPGVYDYYRKIGMLQTLCNTPTIVVNPYRLVNWIKYYANEGQFRELLPHNYISFFEITQTPTVLTCTSLECLDYTKGKNLLLNGYVFNYIVRFDKDITSLFSEGLNGGLLDVALVASTNYYLYLIQKEDFTSDLFLSPTTINPLVLPTDFIYKQLIAYAWTDSVVGLHTAKIDSFDLSGSLVLSSKKNTGIKLNKETPQFGWRDIIGEITEVSGGGTAPSLSAFRGGQIQLYAFSVGDKVANIIYHLPHDYAIGTDLFFHLHWAHNGTAISGRLLLPLITLMPKVINKRFLTQKKQKILLLVLRTLQRYRDTSIILQKYKLVLLAGRLIC